MTNAIANKTANPGRWLMRTTAYTSIELPGVFMKPASIALILMGATMLILNGAVIYIAIRRFGLRGYWSHNPFEALPERAAPWFRAALVVLIIGCAVRIIFYS